jgi:hypothetical protein
MSDRVAIDPENYAAAAAQTLQNATATVADIAGGAAGAVAGAAGAAGADPLSAAMSMEIGQWSLHAEMIGTSTGAPVAQRTIAATGTAGELTGTDVKNAGEIGQQA